jgi:hypothetical protein
MHNELRYQAKMHVISEKLSKEKIKFYIFSPNLFIFIFMKNIKHALMVKKLILACMARSNLSLGREVQNYQDRKAATRHAFFIIPK